MPSGGDSTTTVVTFSVELLLYTTLLTASSWFVEHYLAIMRVPALAFVVLDPLAVMAPVSTAMLVLFFSVGDKASSGGFADDSVAQATQGFTVVASIMWGLLVACMFVEVPRVSSVPGHEPAASALVMAIIIGFGALVPLLAMIVTYAAVPGGQRNSLVFNGAAVGSFSLLFLVILALGNGGVTKCPPYAGAGTSFIFAVLVIIYWVALYAVELLVFSEWDPIASLWNKVTGQTTNSRKRRTHWYSAVLGHFSVNYWRVVGAIVNEIALGTALGFTQSTVHGLVVVVMLVVAALHVPMVLKFHAQIDVPSAVPTADVNQAGYVTQPAMQGPPALPSRPPNDNSAPPQYQQDNNVPQYQNSNVPPQFNNANGPPVKGQYHPMQVFQATATPMHYLDSPHHNQRIYSNSSSSNNNTNNNHHHQRQINNLTYSERTSAQSVGPASFPFVGREYDNDTLPRQRRGMGVM
jgi:hypothetical protein